MISSKALAVIAYAIAIDCLTFSTTAGALIFNAPILCPKWRFDCLSETAPAQCISQDLVCDGRSDCVNGKDESLDVCSKEKHQIKKKAWNIICNLRFQDCVRSRAKPIDGCICVEGPPESDESVLCGCKMGLISDGKSGCTSWVTAALSCNNLIFFSLNIGVPVPAAQPTVRPISQSSSYRTPSPSASPSTESSAPTTNTPDEVATPQDGLGVNK